MPAPPVCWRWSRYTPARGTRRARRLVIAGVCAVTGCAAACGPWQPPRYEQRVAAAEQGLTGDPAIEARRDQVAAALARERGEVAIDEVEFRAQNEYDGDNHGLRLRTRIPIPSPSELRARRRARRAETEEALSLLEDAALGRRAELCSRSVESVAYRERTALYDAYARRQRALLAWSATWKRAGSLSEQAAIRFEIEVGIKLATRRPGPAPAPGPLPLALPSPGRPAHRLIRSPELVRDMVRTHNPAVAVHDAASERYQALSAAANSQRRPWLKFVDLTYAPITRGDSDHAGGTQVAVRIPFGAGPRAAVDRYGALSEGSLQEGSEVVLEQTRLAMMALEELDHFEMNTTQWDDLLALARRAETVAQRWSKARLARPSEVADLTDRAYTARIAVLEAQTGAAAARCTLLAATGVALEDWPREDRPE